MCRKMLTWGFCWQKTHNTYSSIKTIDTSLSYYLVLGPAFAMDKILPFVVTCRRTFSCSILIIPLILVPFGRFFSVLRLFMQIWIYIECRVVIVLGVLYISFRQWIWCIVLFALNAGYRQEGLFYPAVWKTIAEFLVSRQRRHFLALVSSFRSCAQNVLPTSGVTAVFFSTPISWILSTSAVPCSNSVVVVLVLASTVPRWEFRSIRFFVRCALVPS